MILTVRSLYKSFSVNPILSDISFTLQAGDRAAIVGMNGVGKSTLLRIIIGEEAYDSGTLTLGKDVEIGYLPQVVPSFHGDTISELIYTSFGNLRAIEQRMHELEARLATATDETLMALLDEYGQLTTRFQDRGGYDLDHRIDTVLEGLNISYLSRDRLVSTLSGGEKTRVGLAMLLLRQPDLLLLDEPTNHLDITALEWLEKYLMQYHGALLVVSHDRQFLNKTVNVIYEIDEHTRRTQRCGNDYDTYLQTKAAARGKWQEDYQRQQEVIQELRKRAREMGRQVGHNRPARDNDKTLYKAKGENVQKAMTHNIRDAQERLRRIESDPIEKPPMPLSFSPRFTAEPLQADTVLIAEKISKTFDNRTLFCEVDLTLGAQTRMMIVGPNGVGKTTLLRILAGYEQPDAGIVRMVNGARVGFLSQEAHVFAPTQTLLAAFKEDDPTSESNLVASLLAHGLFRLEDVTKLVSQLSAGQRRKLELARLLRDQPNILLLDEPTNYLSLDVLDAFEAAVVTFPGPVIAISHDRWFIQRFGGEIWRLSRQGLNLDKEIG